MKRHGLAAALLITATAPAAAADYYIVRDPDATTCTIVDTRPRGPLRILGNIFNSREEAEAQLTEVCRNETAPTVIEHERVVPRDDEETVIERRVEPSDDDAVVVEERRTKVIEPDDDVPSGERVIIHRD